MLKFPMTTKIFRSGEGLDNSALMFYFRPGGDLPLAYVSYNPTSLFWLLHYTSVDHFHHGPNCVLFPVSTIYRYWLEASHASLGRWIPVDEPHFPHPVLPVVKAKTELSPGAIVAKNDSWSIGKVVEMDEGKDRCQIKWENSYFLDGSLHRRGSKTWVKRDRLILLG